MRIHVTRALIAISTLFLLLCATACLLSYYVGFSVTYAGESAGAARGEILWSHSAQLHRALSLIYEPVPPNPRPIPGPSFFGFRYLTSSTGFRLIGIPLWLPMLVSGAALAAGLRARRRRDPMACRTCGYDCRATPDRCPECGSLTPTLQALLRRCGRAVHVTYRHFAAARRAPPARIRGIC